MLGPCVGSVCGIRLWDLSASHLAGLFPITSCTPQPPLSLRLFWGNREAGKGSVPSSQWVPTSPTSIQAPALLFRPLLFLILLILAGFGVRMGKRRGKPTEFFLLGPVSFGLTPPRSISDFCSRVTR